MAEVTEVDSRLLALRELLNNPSANYTAVAVAVAAGVTFVLTIILTLIAVVMPKRGMRASTDAARPTPQLGVAGIVLIVIIVVFGVAGGAALWYQQTSSDEFCSQTCHSMEAASVSWAQSPHSTVSCIRCHEDSSFSAIPRNATYRLYYVYREYVARGQIVPLAVPASRCLSCHLDIADTQLVARDGSRFTHRAILDAGTSCRSCHRSQGHEPRRK